MKTMKLLLIILCLLFLCSCGSAPQGDPTTVTRSDIESVPSASTDPVSDSATPHYTGSEKDYEYCYTVTRDSDWERDVVYLASVFLQKHPKVADISYTVGYVKDGVQQLVTENNLYDEKLRNTFISEIEQLLIEVPKLSDIEIQYELQRIVALIDDAHSSFYANYAGNQAIFPVYFELLEENGEVGLYAVRTLSVHEDIIFKRLVSINGVPVNDVIDRLRPYVSSENSYWEMTRIACGRWDSLIIQKDLLQIIDVLPADAKCAKFEFSAADGTITVIELEPVSYGSVEKETLVSKDFYSQGIGWYENTTKGNYWYELVDENSLYMRVSLCREHKDYSFSAFCAEILEKLQRSDDVRKLIIDLRHNTGGTFPMSGFKDFTAKLQKFSSVDIYVLADSVTYSAGHGMATYLEIKLPNAVLVGTPTAHPLQLCGNSEVNTLPKSKMRFAISNRYYIYEPDYEHSALIPEITIRQTLNDYINHIDTVLDVVKAM